MSPLPNTTRDAKCRLHDREPGLYVPLHPHDQETFLELLNLYFFVIKKAQICISSGHRKSETACGRRSPLEGSGREALVIQ